MPHSTGLETMQGDIPRRCFTEIQPFPRRSHPLFQYPSSSKSYINLRRLLPASALIVVSLFFTIQQLLQYNSNSGSLQSFRVNYHEKISGNSTDKLQSECLLRDGAAIPNIVHFIHLVDPNPTPEFRFLFHQFVAIYSAQYHLQPEVIYIHTNMEHHFLEKTLRNTTNPYVQAISKLPTVHFKHHKVINETSKGLHVYRLPNQSDFVRTDVVKTYGGIYLDDDAYILRNLDPLRCTGFENVIGTQEGGQMCSAVILAKPENELMTAYDALQDEIFDGTWDRHSTILLATLAKEFAAIEHQVLVLPQETLFPLSWKEGDLHTIYDIHEDDEDGEKKSKYIHDTSAFAEQFNHWHPHTWRRDWRSSYVLHGWTSAIRPNFDSKEKIERAFGRFGGITLEYVLARNSNFARAVYPAVKDALDKGLLDHVKREPGHLQA